MLEPIYVVGSTSFILCNLHGHGKGVLVWWMVKGRLLNFFTCALLHNSRKRSMALNTHVVQANWITVMWKNIFCPPPSWPGDCKYVFVWESGDYRNEQKTLVCLNQGGVVCLCFEWMRVAFCKWMCGVSWTMEQWITKGYATKEDWLQVMMKWCFMIVCWDAHFSINKIQISCALIATCPVKKCSHPRVYCMVYTTLLTCSTLSSNLPFR